MQAASASAGAAPRGSPASAGRIFYLDALRVVLTVLVIAHHVGQACGPTGGYWPVQEPARAPILGAFFTVNRSFFMSLFFMISGYFMVGAYERNRLGRFLRNRLVRLGIPVLVFAGLMIPARIFLFGEHISRWDDVVNAAHLWYIEHVLLFSVVYVLARRIREGSRAPVPAPQSAVRRTAPGLLVTFVALLGVAVACGLVRIWSPIDRWMNLLGFFRVAVADVPRDLAFFIVGALAFRRGWFESFPTRRGVFWLCVGLGAAAAWYALALVPHRGFGLAGSPIFYLVWEELVCFGLCIGLLVLFRQFVTSQGRFGRMLAANQYSAYFWHPLLIVGIQMAFLSLPLGPLAKFAAVTLIGVPLVFLWSWLLRRIPAVRAVL